MAQSEPLVERIMAYSVGVSYPAINASDIGRFAIPLPPLDEQLAISAFLDRETARIDQLIAGLDVHEIASGIMARMARLLKEYRSALITAAVTGQIDVRGLVQ